MNRVADDELDQSSLGALGWYNLAVSNLDAADYLVASNSFRTSFDAPMQTLYAHAWELALKACIRKQELAPSQIRKEFGHRLDKIWCAVDRDRFKLLQLRDELLPFIRHLTTYHSNRLNHYPLAGYHRPFDLAYMRANSSRLRIPRIYALKLFGV